MKKSTRKLPVGIHRESAAREREMELIAELYCKGWGLVKIGDKIGISRTQVMHDLRALRREWVRSGIAKIEERVATELAKIDNLEAVAWMAWDRSKEDNMTYTVTTLEAKKIPGKKKGPPRKKTQEIRKPSSGDPRFLERVSWCIDQRCKILGILRPDTGGMQTTITVVGGVDLGAIVGAKKIVNVELLENKDEVPQQEE